MLAGLAGCLRSRWRSSPLEVAQRRPSQRQGSEGTQHHKVHYDRLGGDDYHLLTTEGTSHTSEEHRGRLPSVALRAPDEGPKALTDRQRRQDVSIVTVANVDLLA